MISFFVPGLPGTKGSAKAFVVQARGGKARAVITNDNPKAKPWAALVSLTAARTMDDAAGTSAAPWTGPVEVKTTFWLPRPASHMTGKGLLKRSAPAHVTKKPDGDKMVRAAWDALTGIVFADDSQIVLWSGAKLYAEAGLGQQVGTRIDVIRIGQPAP